MNNAEVLSTTHRHKNLKKKRTHTLPILIYSTISQPCIICRQKQNNFSCIFIALPEYRKKYLKKD